MCGEGGPLSHPQCGQRANADWFSQRRNGGSAVIIDRDYCVWNAGTVLSTGARTIHSLFKKYPLREILFQSIVISLFLSLVVLGLSVGQ